MGTDTELDIKNGLNSRKFTTLGTESAVSTISATLISDLDSQKLDKERLERYADEAGDSRYTSEKRSSDDTLLAKTVDLREKIISKALVNINRSMQVDLCFV